MWERELNERGRWKWRKERWENRTEDIFTDFLDGISTYVENLRPISLFLRCMQVKWNSSKTSLNWQISECDKSLCQLSRCTAWYKQCAVSVIWENRSGWENRIFFLPDIKVILWDVKTEVFLGSVLLTPRELLSIYCKKPISTFICVELLLRPKVKDTPGSKRDVLAWIF